MTVSLKPVVDFLVRQPDFPILNYCLVDHDYKTTPIYPPVGVSNYNTTDYSGLAKWISDNEKTPPHGSAIWALDYVDLFKRLLSDPAIPAEIKQAIETHCPDLPPQEQAAKIIDQFIINPFFETYAIRLIQLYIVFPPGGSSSVHYNRIVEIPITE